MYGVAGGMLTPEARLLFVELLLATIKHFISKRVQFLEVD
jgi:hypothetical protein